MAYIGIKKEGICMGVASGATPGPSIHPKYTGANRVKETGESMSRHREAMGDRGL